MNYNPTQWLDHWFASHDNLVTLTAWMANNGFPADEVAFAVEKPWKYENEFLAAKHDLSYSLLDALVDEYESELHEDEDDTLEAAIIKLAAEANDEHPRPKL